MGRTTLAKEEPQSKVLLATLEHLCVQTRLGCGSKGLVPSVVPDLQGGQAEGDGPRCLPEEGLLWFPSSGCCKKVSWRPSLSGFLSSQVILLHLFLSRNATSP